VVTARALRCEHCGKEFVAPVRARPGPAPKYCGRTCRQRAYELRQWSPELDALRKRVRMLERLNARMRAELIRRGWTSDDPLP
jgi:hypothetical protein